MCLSALEVVMDTTEAAARPAAGAKLPAGVWVRAPWLTEMVACGLRACSHSGRKVPTTKRPAKPTVTAWEKISQSLRIDEGDGSW